MMSTILQPPSGGALSRVLLLVSLMGVIATPAMGQDEAAADPAAAASPDAAAPAEAAAPPAEGEPAPADAPVDTIPVDQQAEAPPAAEPSRRPYTFAATRLRHTEFDDAAEDGFGIEGSLLVLPNVYAVAAVLASESDDARGTESTQFEIGGGFLAPLSAGTDFNGTIRLIQRDVNSEPQSVVKMGFEADVGVRTDLMPRLEGNLAARYSEASRTSRIFLTGGVLFGLTPALSLGAEVLASTNSTAYGLVGRWAF